MDSVGRLGRRAAGRKPMIFVWLYISRFKVYSGSMMVSGFALPVGKPQAKVLWNLPRFKDLASTCRTVAVLYLTVLM